MSTEANSSEGVSADTVKGWSIRYYYYKVFKIKHFWDFLIEPSDDPQVDTSETTDETTQTSTGVKRKRTETKDPNAPKRPATAYIFFNTEMRPKVKEEHPEMGLSERSKLVGKMWANLTPEKKQV